MAVFVHLIGKTTRFGYFQFSTSMPDHVWVSFLCSPDTQVWSDTKDRSLYLDVVLFCPLEFIESSAGSLVLLLLYIYRVYVSIFSVLKKLRSSSSMRVKFSNNELTLWKHKNVVEFINLSVSILGVILKKCIQNEYLCTWNAGLWNRASLFVLNSVLQPNVLILQAFCLAQEDQTSCSLM